MKSRKPFAEHLLLSAEEQIVRGLPTMMATTVDTQLRQVFQSHLQETELHVTRLRNILETISGEVEPLKCKTLSALFDETEEQVHGCSHDSVRDAALIAGAQRIEHYEIGSYGTLRHFAHVLGRSSDTEILDHTIHEEGHADHFLSTIAERVNPAAKRARAA
jgi:ferritin-like metal-binding protein YciE